MADLNPFAKVPPLMPPKSAKKQPVDPALFDKTVKNVNELAANLRILEERYGLMRNKSQLSEKNLIDVERDCSKDIKMLSDEIMELKHELKNILDKLRLISEEMKNLVDKNEFRVVERYVDMWQPMNFITRNELNRMLMEKQNAKQP